MAEDMKPSYVSIQVFSTFELFGDEPSHRQEQTADTMVDKTGNSKQSASL